MWRDGFRGERAGVVFVGTYQDRGVLRGVDSVHARRPLDQGDALFPLSHYFLDLRRVGFVRVLAELLPPTAHQEAAKKQKRAKTVEEGPGRGAWVRSRNEGPREKLLRASARPG